MNTQPDALQDALPFIQEALRALDAARSAVSDELWDNLPEPVMSVLDALSDAEDVLVPSDEEWGPSPFGGSLHLAS